jgi:predicted nucleotidyltransferase
MEAYPSYDQIRRSRREARRREALQAVRQAEERAHAAGARLMVFGSLAEGGFGEDSDIDIAVFGLPAGPDTALTAEIDTMLGLAGFSADVVPERFLPPSLRERILRHGAAPGALE